MNSLPRWWAHDDDRAISEAAARDNARPAVTVLSTSWHNYPSTDPDSMDVELSDGRLLVVKWSLEYSCRFLSLWEGERLAGRECTAEETGLLTSTLETLVSEVRDAALDWDTERMSDSMDDGQDWRDGR